MSTVIYYIAAVQLTVMGAELALSETLARSLVAAALFLITYILGKYIIFSLTYFDFRFPYKKLIIENLIIKLCIISRPNYRLSQSFVPLKLSKLSETFLG